MPDTGKKRRWPDRVWVRVPSRTGLPLETAQIRHQLRGSEPYMPVSEHEAASARARKEGREEVWGWLLQLPSLDSLTKEGS